MEPLEIEVKFFLPQIDPIRDRLLELGARARGRVFETNIRFEDTHNTLIRKKILLRLRKDAQTTLTVKSEPSVPDTQFKILRELEVKVSDFSTTHQILESVGFHPEQTYEKWRETFDLKDVHFCIDTLPYGNFLEIEGEKEAIKDYARRLGLKWEKRILLNYLALFDILRQKFSLPFSDATFSNFKTLDVDPADYFYLFEEGRQPDIRTTPKPDL